MPTFKYEGAYASGERATGVVEAVSQSDAVAQIRQSCEVVLSLKEVPKITTRDPMSRLKKITAKSLALTCKQFSIILKSGLPLMQTLELVADQCADKNLALLLRQVSEDVSNGWPLSYSLENRGGGKLPVTFLETVRAGEDSGDLQAAFERMADYFERMNKTRESLLGALTYPAFVLVVAAVVIAVVMAFVIPTFTGMFNGMGVELPWATRALIALSGFFRRYFLAIIAAIALAVLSVRLFGTTEKGGPIMARMQLRLPLIGSIVRMTVASQFAHTMSTLLTAGMPLLQAIEVSGRTMTNLCMAQDVLEALPGVEGGRSFGECLSYSKELPPMLTQMVAVGEATGSMETTLQVLAAYYDSETDVKTKRALTLLEPIIIVVLAVFVGFILIAVYLPMFSLYSNM